MEHMFPRELVTWPVSAAGLARAGRGLPRYTRASHLLPFVIGSERQFMSDVNGNCGLS